jgi:hypothetical protein
MSARKPKTVKELPTTATVNAGLEAKLMPAPVANRHKVFKDVCAKLSEFFDAGVITVTWSEAGKTLRLHEELGNNFAVAGLLEQLAMDHSEGLCQDLEDDDDEDNEDWKKKTPA